jgi:elongator complex protein 4
MTSSFRKHAQRQEPLPQQPLLQQQQQQKQQHQLPPSTRISSHNGMIITSTGIPSLDTVFGGGIPCSTLTLLHEDTCNYAGAGGGGGYVRLMMRYFLAQGVAAGHSVCIASCALDEHPLRILKQIMAPVGVAEDQSVQGGEDDQDEEDEMTNLIGSGQARRLGSLRSASQSSNAVEDRMTIAWRYQNQAKFGHVAANKSPVIRGLCIKLIPCSS